MPRLKAEKKKLIANKVVFIIVIVAIAPLLAELKSVEIDYNTFIYL
jgi:hypothetical protein